MRQAPLPRSVTPTSAGTSCTRIHMYTPTLTLILLRSMNIKLWLHHAAGTVAKVSHAHFSRDVMHSHSHVHEFSIHSLAHSQAEPIVVHTRMHAHEYIDLLEFGYRFFLKFNIFFSTALNKDATNKGDAARLARFEQMTSKASGRTAEAPSSSGSMSTPML